MIRWRRLIAAPGHGGDAGGQQPGKPQPEHAEKNPAEGGRRAPAPAAVTVMLQQPGNAQGMKQVDTDKRPRQQSENRDGFIFIPSALSTTSSQFLPAEGRIVWLVYWQEFAAGCCGGRGACTNAWDNALTKLYADFGR